MSKLILMIEGLICDVRNREVFREEGTAYWDRKGYRKSQVGDDRSVGIPGNIPNPEVKRVSADGTWRAASWESKKLPT